MDHLESLKGKRVLVSGGTTGIGRAIAHRLVDAGAKVLVYGRDPQHLQDALDEIQRCSGGEIAGFLADQSTLEGVRFAFEQVDSRLGGLDILINNAGDPGGSVEEISLEEIDSVVRGNLGGYILAAKLAAERFPEGEGQIVNVGSLTAELRGKGTEVYVATKTGIQGFSAALRKTLAEKGIRVTLVEPGLIEANLKPDVTPEENQAQIEQNKMLPSNDVAFAVEWVLSLPKRMDISHIGVEPTRQEFEG